jgi:hypothetical protein
MPLNQYRRAPKAAAQAPPPMDVRRVPDMVWSGRRADILRAAAPPAAPHLSSAATAAIPQVGPQPATPAAARPPALPDVNGLVDEVMRRIDRQFRSERLRRGL